MAEKSGQKFLRVPTNRELDRRLQAIADRQKEKGKAPSVRSLALALIEAGLQQLEAAT